MKRNNILQTAIIIVVFSIIFTFSVKSQQKQFKVVSVAFYNLENLFDTLDTPDKNDFEYTPEGDNKWDSKKYNTKLERMSEAIVQIGADVTKAPPAVIGVSEIENRKVLEDLVAMPLLKPFNYKVVHYESPDRRGVDVALLYQSAILEVINTTSTTLKVEGRDDFFTRDQLVVSGIVDGEKIHFIVNHWPSRSGGESTSRPLRNAAADLTRSLADSIMLIDPDAKIIIMGDLNDDPSNESLLKHLKAKKTVEETKPGDLYNPMYEMYKKGIGTLAYRDAWNIFDQLIVSYPLINKDETGFKLYKTKVFDKDFLKNESGKYKGYPKRTHAGGVYQGGYSDHFPVYLFLTKEIK
ncbi:MAG: endonuclease [Bacteroidetes bacterium GWC2_33_15]|nr:MAG: endonuclease [Bacteroidetes bacterium GWA2_33_15]OFX48684.1 MAG: endonuclease [Bacteroidetes bacterium GWC2_33_15]OFX65073.1 MAG: endonuclease [Bacteroidetes bacterium GWB2_32_14]OFX69159.1 MAG: endonuclease [Bacteroidetes bacterium GWD2_33_33]